MAAEKLEQPLKSHSWWNESGIHQHLQFWVPKNKMNQLWGTQLGTQLTPLKVGETNSQSGSCLIHSCIIRRVMDKEPHGESKPQRTQGHWCHRPNSQHIRGGMNDHCLVVQRQPSNSHNVSEFGGDIQRQHQNHQGIRRA